MRAWKLVECGSYWFSWRRDVAYGRQENRRDSSPCAARRVRGVRDVVIRSWSAVSCRRFDRGQKREATSGEGQALDRATIYFSDEFMCRFSSFVFFV